MVKIMNASMAFTILYLPSRSLRVRGKEIVEITDAEFESKHFKIREKDFYVIKDVEPVKVEEEVVETPVINTIPAITPKKRNKSTKIENENSEIL